MDDLTPAEIRYVRRAIRDAYAKGRAAGLAEAMPVLKALSAGTPTPPPEPADDRDPTHAALMSVLFEAAEEALDRGDDPGEAVRPLLDLLADPAALAGVLGDAGLDDATVGKAFRVVKAWDHSKHPRDDHGRFVSKDAIQEAAGDPKKADELRDRVTDPDQRAKLDAAIADQEGTVGRTKRGQARHESRQRAQTRDEARRRFKDISERARYGDASADELYEAADLIATGHLTADDLRLARGRLDANFKGSRRYEDMRKALSDHVRRVAFEARAGEQGFDPEELSPTATNATNATNEPPITPNDPPIAPAPGPVAEPVPASAPQAPAGGAIPESVGAADGGKPKVEYVRAAAGGQVSEVDGKFYGGGQLMPVHGRYSGQQKPPPKVATGTAEPVQAREDSGGGPGGSRGPQLSPEERRERAENQRKWDEMNAGPLGKLMWLGTSPNSKAFDPKNQGIRLDKWREFAESVGPDGINRLVAALEPEFHGAVDSSFQAIRDKNDLKKQAGEWNPQYHRDVDADAEEWEKNQAKVRAAEAVSMMRGGKGHEKKVPGSHYARELVREMMRSDNNPGRSMIDAYHRLHQILSGADAPPAPAPTPVVPAQNPSAGVDSTSTSVDNTPTPATGTGGTQGGGKVELPKLTHAAHKWYTVTRIGKDDAASREALKAAGWKYNANDRSWYKAGEHHDAPGQIEFHAAAVPDLKGKYGDAAWAARSEAEKAAREVFAAHRSSAVLDAKLTHKTDGRYAGTPLVDSVFVVKPKAAAAGGVS